MRPVLTGSEYRRVDSSYEGDLVAAMDRAGHAVAMAALRVGVGYGANVVVLAGPGNNGGDGYVAARYLRERGASVTVHALGEPRSAEAIDAAEKARSVGVPIRDLDSPVEADLVIDAIFGGGGRRGLPKEVLAWMGTEASVVAVDYPTGLDPDSGKVEEVAFSAVETVTFASLKTGHLLGKGPDHCGVVTVADIGVEGGKPSMYVVEENDAPRPGRHRKSHKWAAGAVLVVGGSQGLVGASVLASRAALHFGAGTVYATGPSIERMQASAPEIPVLSMERAEEMIDRFDVVVAGPGLSQADSKLVQPLVEAATKVLLDAGAITPSFLEAAKAHGGEVVVTPHDGEFGRIAGVSPGTYATRSLAASEQIVVVRKGNPTMVSDGNLPLLVTSGGPELASIGTGDVLAGMIGSLWSRGLGRLASAVSGAYWHGVAAADLATRRTVTADGLVRHIGRFAW